MAKSAAAAVAAAAAGTGAGAGARWVPGADGACGWGSGQAGGCVGPPLEEEEAGAAGPGFHACIVGCC